MSSHARDDGGRPPAERTPGRQTAPDLRLTVVRYTDGADRGTVHPTGLEGFERTETWMSVDMSAVVALSAWR